MQARITTILPHLIAAVMCITGCGEQDKPVEESNDIAPAETREALFRSLSPEKSNLLFTNTVQENSEQNYYRYEYLYNGGGVAVGDVNNDGLPDIYLTGNLVPDKLYLNKGGLVFEDITESAITQGADGWHSGVTMADVNDDGYVDIYVCRAGWYTDPELRRNLLYINNGDLTFSERGAAFGVDDTTRSTHAAFFDLEKDGDLDLYVMNTPLQGSAVLNNAEVKELVARRRSPSDRLYRNDGGTYSDITASAGIWNMGYGLGLSVSDLDKNGNPDIYVANDYIERDFHYQNDGGNLSEVLDRSMRHISNFGMGCDAADINNDGLPDLMVVDMVSPEHVRSKRNMSGMSREKFWRANKAGYHLQYMFNTLQLNNGNGTFSEIANMAGIAKTDWSWAPLFADFDNDGHKDLLVTNGYKRDMRDNDYMLEADQLRKTKANISFDEVLALVPTNQIRNYLFRNNGDLTFEDVSESWGFKNKINSNGAAYADLDRDGDLDLIINNMDARTEIYENTSNNYDNHYIQFAFEDAYGANANGVKVTIRNGDELQYQELICSRGYQSSMEPVVHFGLADKPIAESVEVVWPDNSTSVYHNLPADSLHVLVKNNSGLRDSGAETPLLTEVKGRAPFVHKENEYDDFEVEVLLPHKLSELGPHLSTADVNGDGIGDIYIGGARGQSGQLLLGNTSGSFRASDETAWQIHASSEDLGSLFFDADADGDMDLYVVSGSNETSIHFNEYNDRLYLNDGAGRFSDASDRLPPMQTSAQRVCASDIDNDGDMDLFVGGRGIPGQYPKPPRSYLLRNDGSGRFTDVTADFAMELLSPGLVTDALFTDHDGDGDEDLFLVGEWLGLSLFDNTEFGFVKKEMPEFTNTEGWWMSISVGDMDGDGDEDILAGNVGLNNKFHPSPIHPLHVYWNDFDNNGKADIVLAKEKDAVMLPVRGRECSSEQCPMILDKFPSYNAFANASLEQVYGVEKLSKGLHLQANDFASYLLINSGDGHYQKMKLPNIAQIAPIMGSAFVDVDNDGKMDLVTAGNMWGAEVETVRYDAGNGLVLLGDGTGKFRPLSVSESGFFAPGNVKDLLVVQLDNKPTIIIANNNGPVQQFRPTRANRSLSYQP
jgi:hypothetical protein